MAIEMIMPRVDQEQETAAVLEWLKTEGQQVSQGETILVIETDKIAIDVEAPATGTLAGISAHPGDIIPVGRVIAYILSEGEELPEGAAPPAAAPESAGGEAPAGRGEVQEGGRIPLSNMRRTIVERLNASYRNIPHIQFSDRAEMTNFIQVREKLNHPAQRGAGEKVSVTALLVKLAAMTLADHPLLNSSLVDEAILLHEEVNLGLAVALEQGLIIPVIKQADQKGLRQIALETADLIDRARAGSLTSAEIRGATFTLSNLGPLGLEQFSAIINPPQVAVLATGAILPAAVPLEGGEIAARPVMRFTLSADHRVVDGAVAARFLADLKARLQDPAFLVD